MQKEIKSEEMNRSQLMPEMVYPLRARRACMDFCYFERDLEVYSDEEGVYKNINGYRVGDTSVHALRKVL